MTRYFAGLSVVVSLCLGAPAHAQYVNSTRDWMTTPVPPKFKDIVRSDKQFRGMAECVVDRQTGRVEYLLQNTAPGSENEQNIARSLQSAMDWCLPGFDSIGFSWNILRGGLAEALYDQNYPEGIEAGSLPNSDWVSTWIIPRMEEGGAPQLELLHSAARCLVAKRPADVQALLETDSMSPAEMNAIGKLQGDLGACLFKGMTLNTNRQSLRGLLAEAMLEFAIAQKNGFQVAAASEKK